MGSWKPMQSRECVYSSSRYQAQMTIYGILLPMQRFRTTFFAFHHHHGFLSPPFYRGECSQALFKARSKSLRETWKCKSARRGAVSPLKRMVRDKWANLFKEYIKGNERESAAWKVCSLFLILFVLHRFCRCSGLFSSYTSPTYLKVPL